MPNKPNILTHLLTQALCPKVPATNHQKVHSRRKGVSERSASHHHQRSTSPLAGHCRQRSSDNNDLQANPLAMGQDPTTTAWTSQ